MVINFKIYLFFFLCITYIMNIYNLLKNYEYKCNKNRNKNKNIKQYKVIKYK